MAQHLHIPTEFSNRGTLPDIRHPTPFRNFQFFTTNFGAGVCFTAEEFGICREYTTKCRNWERECRQGQEVFE
jgi:hypothetical protein